MERGIKGIISQAFIPQVSYREYLDKGVMHCVQTIGLESERAGD